MCLLQGGLEGSIIPVVLITDQFPNPIVMLLVSLKFMEYSASFTKSFAQPILLASQL